MLGRTAQKENAYKSRVVEPLQSAILCNNLWKVAGKNRIAARKCGRERCIPAIPACIRACIEVTNQFFEVLYRLIRVFAEHNSEHNPLRFSRIERKRKHQLRAFYSIGSR